LLFIIWGFSLLGTFFSFQGFSLSRSRLNRIPRTLFAGYAPYGLPTLTYGKPTLFFGDRWKPHKYWADGHFWRSSVSRLFTVGVTTFYGRCHDFLRSVSRLFTVKISHSYSVSRLFTVGVTTFYGKNKSFLLGVTTFYGKNKSFLLGVTTFYGKNKSFLLGVTTFYGRHHVTISTPKTLLSFPLYVVKSFIYPSIFQSFNISSTISLFLRNFSLVPLMLQ